MDFKTILVETRDNVGLITFNRPDALNALSSEVVGELVQALDAFETDAAIGASNQDSHRLSLVQLDRLRGTKGSGRTGILSEISARTSPRVASP